MSDDHDNVIPIGGKRSKKKAISFREIPTGIKIKVHAMVPNFVDRLRRATDSEGWLDIVPLCSNFVIDVVGKTGYSQDALDECAKVLNFNLGLHGFDVRVRFELVGPQAVRIDVLAKPAHTSQRGS